MVLGLAGSSLAAAPGVARGPVRVIRPVRVEQATVAGLRVELSPPCRAQVLAELVEGRRRSDACGPDRVAAGRAVVHGRDAFGFVERREVDLTQLRLVLGIGHRCRRWPLRSPERDVLRHTDVDEAGCRLRRYHGELSLVLVDRAGRRHEPLSPVHTDRDGRVTLRFSALDRELRVRGEGTLDDYVRIELGEASWAGYVNLEQLLRFRADWHLAWLLRGRGTPGLFVARHPTHPNADDARTMTAEAQLARQARDYARVEAGELPAQEFADRHPRSPYQRRVESWVRARAAKARRLDDARPEETEAPAPAPARAQPPPAADLAPSGGGSRGGATGGMGP